MPHFGVYRQLTAVFQMGTKVHCFKKSLYYKIFSFSFIFLLILFSSSRKHSIVKIKLCRLNGCKCHYTYNCREAFAKKKRKSVTPKKYLKPKL